MQGWAILLVKTSGDNLDLLPAEMVSEALKFIKVSLKTPVRQVRKNESCPGSRKMLRKQQSATETTVTFLGTGRFPNTWKKIGATQSSGHG